MKSCFPESIKAANRGNSVLGKLTAKYQLTASEVEISKKEARQT